MVFTGFHHGCHFEKSRHGDVLCGPTNVEQVALKLCCGDWHMIPGKCIIINHQKDRSGKMLLKYWRITVLFFGVTMRRWIDHHLYTTALVESEATRNASMIICQFGHFAEKISATLCIFMKLWHGGLWNSRIIYRTLIVPLFYAIFVLDL